MRKRTLIIAFISFLISGCVTNQKIEALENYIGKNIDDIVLSKGVATSKFETSDGNTFEYCGVSVTSSKVSASFIGTIIVYI